MLAKEVVTAPIQPHLLYVAWGFPPARSGGVYRALATANAFAAHGWKVTVLTANRETFTAGTGIDPTLEAQIHPDISVVRIPFSGSAYQTDLRSWSRFRANAPEVWNTIRAAADRRKFPEPTYGGWRPALEKAALGIHERTPVDLVLSTANPYVDFTAGSALHDAHDVPYVMDYRDAWQLDVFSGRRLSARGGAVDRWEERLIADAAEVWFVNEPIQRWHQDLYPDASDRMHVVSNGFDSNMSEIGVDVRPDRDAGLVFGYIGTVSGHVPMRQFFEGWRKARRRSPVLAASRVDIYGYLDHSGIPNDHILGLFAEFRDDGISYRGPVGKTEIVATYATMDALLLILGTGRYVTSGKVYEYTATGLPVVSIHDPGNAATQVLDGSPVWTPAASLSPDDIADALVAAAEQSVAQTPASRASAQAWSARYERLNQLVPRILALRTAARPAANDEEEDSR